jgi:hypothetical protein
VEEAGVASYRKMQAFPIAAFRQAYTVLWNGRWVPAPTYGGGPQLYPLWNSQQQGGVARIVAPAIIAVHEWLESHPELASEIYIMYHDSIIVAVPEDDEDIMRQVGTFVAQQLMTQIPYEMTVVKGHKVPWPSGCDLYENQKKWGWRPDKDFPYEYGKDEGEVIITYPEENAWQDMLEQAHNRLEVALRKKEKEITYWENYVVCEAMPWYNGEDIEPLVNWSDIVGNSTRAELNAQARFWEQALQMSEHNIPENAVQIVGDFVEWVQLLDTLDQEYQQLQDRLKGLKDG